MIPREVFEQTLLRFLDPVRPYLDDPGVSEIMINGPHEIYIEKKGQLHKTDARFASLGRGVASRRGALARHLPARDQPRSLNECDHSNYRIR